MQGKQDFIIFQPPSKTNISTIQQRLYINDVEIERIGWGMPGDVF